jgi:putative oxidoreductase
VGRSGQCRGAASPRAGALPYPENWPYHLLWASILAYVLTRGAGRLSVDRLIARRLGLG